MRNIETNGTVSGKQSQLGSQIWADMQSQPLGSLTKRELELCLISAVVKSGLVEASPSEIAQTFRLGLTKAHGYLMDLALRSPAMSDLDALKRLALALRQAEVTPDGNHLIIPLNDAGLRIWLERKLASQQLQQGESLRHELVKLSPVALSKLLDSAQELKKPYLAIKALEKQFGKEAWFVEAKSHWKANTIWGEVVKCLAVDMVGSVISTALSAAINGQLS